MKNKYDDVYIHVSNNTECLATLLLLSKLSGVTINDTSLEEALYNHSFYNFVAIVGGNVVRKANSCSGKKVISFKEIGKLEELLNLKVEVKLNNTYTAIVTEDTIAVGCQKFPISILNDLMKAHHKIIDKQ
jgi:hypothetical protein